MELIDIILAVVLILGVIKGFRNGFFFELASLISILLGIYLAIRFSFVTKSYLEKEVSWDAKTIQVAPNIVSGLVVKTSIFSPSSVVKVTDAPCYFPI